jgi:hypothetical protein
MKTHQSPQTFRRNLFVPGLLCALVLAAAPAWAGTLHVPKEHKTIQAGIDAAKAGDTVLVGPGTYKERVRLKKGITLKSAGDEAKGKLGLRRAEATIIDGNVAGAKGPGVSMAEGSTLDGFTVTGVGQYDDALWKKHYATLGEEQHEENIGVPGMAGIAVLGVSRCTVAHNIVHHIGYTGIAIMGEKGRRVSPHIFRNVTYRNMGGGIGSMKKSTAIIEENICFENYHAGIGHNDASPLVINNVCHGNVRAGIGISEHSQPIVRGNRCYQNRRAGIGIRTGAETQPIVEDNDCYENEMSGIGNRDNARPIIRGNRCWKNKMSGIGSRDGARALIEGNECYENEMSGIGSRLGAAPIIRGNRCYRNKMSGIGAREKSRPVIEDNECFENVMAGIGVRTGAAPVVRNNRCYRNEMAGIGNRLEARPIIVGNTCFENKMAGIGTEEGAAPIIRDNHCYKNLMAGIGNRSGSRPVIVGNESRENMTAGIGVRGDSAAIIVGNRCIENRLVAIGLPDGATAHIQGNELQRTGGGAPPLVAVKGGSSAVLVDNSIRGGGVAGVLVQGTVQLSGNRFFGAGGKQGSAIWVWDKSTVLASGNQFTGYRNALNASGSDVTATDNAIHKFNGAAIIVRKPSAPPRVHGNTAFSLNEKDSAAKVEGARAAEDNVLKKPDEAGVSPSKWQSLWPKNQPEGPWEKGQVTAQDGPWKLVVTHGKTTRYELFNTKDDPQQKTNLADKLEQITFRLRGLTERQ